LTYRLPERTRERTLTTGTGTLDLAGVIFPSEFTFADGLSDGDTTRYCIISGNGVDVEIGEPAIFNTGSPNTLTRNPTRSTNGNAAIDLVGESQVYVCLPGQSYFTDAGDWDPIGAIAQNTTVVFGEQRYVAVEPIPAAPAGAPAIDGHAKHNGTTTGSPVTLNLTTSLADDAIVVLIAINGGKTAAPTASGLAFTERADGNGSPIRYTVGGFTIQEFIARAAAPLAAKTITITPSGSADFSVVAFGANPVNAVYAWDTNSDHLPLAVSGNTIDCTTDGSNLFLIYLDVSDNISFNPAAHPTSFTIIESCDYVPAQMGASGRSVTAQQVGVSLVGSSAAAILSWVDALTSENPPPNVDPRWVPLGTAFGDQAANSVYAGPATGGDAPPTFRALVAADLPSGTATESYADAAASAAESAAEAYADAGDAAITSSIAAATDAAVTSPADNDVLVYINSSSKWTNKRPHYGLAFSAPQTTAYTASQVVGHHDFACAATIPANFGAYLGRSSRAGGSAVAAASTVFSVEKAAAATPNTFSQVGTITFAVGTVTPTFASSGGAAISFAANDRMRIVAPASPDGTFAGFYATIAGYQT
jgi:hypothetical protein